MKFNNFEKPNNSTNSNEKLVDETFIDLEKYARTRDGKEALDTVWDAEKFNIDSNINSKRVKEAKEKYESVTSKEGGINESLREKIGATKEQALEIISRMKALSEQKKKLFGEKVSAGVNKTLLAFGAGGALSTVAGMGMQLMNSGQLNEFLNSPDGKIAAVASLTAMVGGFIGAMRSVGQEKTIQNLKTEKIDLENNVKSELNTSIESSQKQDLENIE